MAKYIESEIPKCRAAGELTVWIGKIITINDKEWGEFCDLVGGQLFPAESFQRQEFQAGVAKAHQEATETDWTKTFEHLFRSYEREMVEEIKEIRDWKAQLPPVDPRKKN
jgi:hypothetical protein